MRPLALTLLLTLASTTPAAAQDAEADADADAEAEVEADADADTGADTEPEPEGTDPWAARASDDFPFEDTAPSVEPFDAPAETRPTWTEAPVTGEPVSHEPPRESADDRRARPDISGRGDPPRDPADDVLWIPRILFSPLYAITEYLLRRPIGAIVSEVERTHLFDTFFDFFTWGDDHQAGLVPTVLYDFGFLPSVGLYLWWNDLGTSGHDLRVVGGFWGDDWLHAKILDRVRFDDQNELSFWVEGLRRPDYIWHGGGWDVQRDQRSRFQRSNLGGGVQFQNHGFWRASGFRYFAMVDYNDFDNSDYDEDHAHQRPIEQAVAFGWFDTLPDGYTDGYFAFRQRLEATLDTREERPAPGHGVRVQAWLEHGLDMQRAEDSHWLRYGGQVAGFVDLGEQRVVQLLGYVDVVDSIGRTDEIPFTELVWLSRQPLTMGGFLPGTLVGRSATVMTLEYHWPIWVWVEGSLHYSVGNAFGPQLGDFDVGRLRQSFGFGFRTIGDRDNSALIMLAFGTEPFVRGADVTSLRFVIGSQSGF